MLYTWCINNPGVFFPTDTSLPRTANRESHGYANILSFDGGGSRGIMEVAVLDYVMRLVTILTQNPNSLEYLIEDGTFGVDQNKIQTLVAKISNVTDPIHPTNVFDMIVGTSTIYVQYRQSESDGQIYFPMARMDPSDKHVFHRRNVLRMDIGKC